MGESIRESRVATVASFELPFESSCYLTKSFIIWHPQTTKMRSLLILLCIGFVYAGSDLFNDEQAAKKWAKLKAMEHCYGKDMMRTYLLKMKKAVVKCTGMDDPTLDLPMFKSPARLVHALLDSAQDHEQMKLLGAMQNLHGSQNSNNQQPIQLVIGQQQAQPKEDFFKKMVMKKLFKDEGPFGYMGMGGDSMKEEGGQGGIKYDILKMLSRNRRATDDVFELGDRLTEKLQGETAKIQAQLGNTSCVLQELNVIDSNQDLTPEAMVKAVERGEWGEFPDEWLKKHSIKLCRQCAAFAEACPQQIVDECPYGEKWARIKMYFHCEKMGKWQMCMNFDMKQKLEKSFGKLEDLEQATGLPENQLLPMTMKLLQDQMDMFD